MTTDLTDVSGISKVKAERLAAAGIETLEVLAAADPADVLEAMDGLPGHSLETVQEWIDEAGQLVATTGGGTPPQRSFVVRITKQADGTVVRTTVEPAAPDSEQSVPGGWEGWAPQQLTSFIAERCGIAAPAGAAAPAPEPSPHEEQDVDIEAMLAEVEAARTAELLEKMRQLAGQPLPAYGGEPRVDTGSARTSPSLGDLAPRRSTVDPATILAAREAERRARRHQHA